MIWKWLRHSLEHLKIMQEKQKCTTMKTKASSFGEYFAQRAIAFSQVNHNKIIRLDKPVWYELERCRWTSASFTVTLAPKSRPNKPHLLISTRTLLMFIGGRDSTGSNQLSNQYKNCLAQIVCSKNINRHRGTSFRWASDKWFSFQCHHDRLFSSVHEHKCGSV